MLEEGWFMWKTPMGRECCVDQDKDKNWLLTLWDFGISSSGEKRLDRPDVNSTSKNTWGRWAVYTAPPQGLSNLLSNKRGREQVNHSPPRNISINTIVFEGKSAFWFGEWLVPLSVSASHHKLEVTFISFDELVWSRHIYPHRITNLKVRSTRVLCITCICVWFPTRSKLR